MTSHKDHQVYISANPIRMPEHLQQDVKKVKKLEWITIFYLVTVIVAMYFSLGSSQAMKAAWLEDLLGLVPAVIFLISQRIVSKKSPSRDYPYGLFKVISVAYLLAAFSLLGMGLFAFYDSSMSLLMREHPTVGQIYLFGKPIWMGWVMIVALLYSLVPAVILGQKKLPYGKRLHNQIISTDANAQKADWQTASAAIVGIIGIGFGLWWFDSVAALFISISIMIDGFSRTKGAVLELIEHVPTKLDKLKEDNPLNYKIYDYFQGLPWVKEVRLRLRDNGQVFFGEAYVIPAVSLSSEEVIAKVEAAQKGVKELDWKVQDITVQLVGHFKN